MKKIDTSEWKEFRIGELFEFKRPMARIKSNYDDGSVPYVSSGGFNNGVCGYLSPKNEKDICIKHYLTNNG